MDLFGGPVCQSDCAAGHGPHNNLVIVLGLRRSEYDAGLHHVRAMDAGMPANGLLEPIFLADFGKSDSAMRPREQKQKSLWGYRDVEWGGPARDVGRGVPSLVTMLA
jgi:hypothetical protein